MIARDHLRRRRDRVLLVEHGVGQRDRQIADGGGVDHVAEIEDRDDARAAGSTSTL